MTHFKRHTFLSTAIFIAVTIFSVLTSSWAQEVSFQHDVRPILSDKCFKCHGFDAKNQESDFRVHTFEEATRDLGGYSGIVPGNSEASEFITRIFSDDPTEIMPTEKSKLSLSEEEKSILKRWVEQGAKYEKHWAFTELPANIDLPRSGQPEVKTEIDEFIFRHLEQENLSPSPETSREKWLRRVSFDLTGLPPTIEELDTFLADSSPNAYETQVDRLLSTTAYAERLTNEWLDVARYSDSYGYQVDRDRRVWPWRDWVIRSFQTNLSYDQFITHQLAGDLLPNATQEMKLATAFNRLHGQKSEGGSSEEEFRQEYIADRANTVGTAFMGLTMECSKCHDHKYDPITQKDYYSLSAFFNNIDESGLYAYFYSNATPTPALDLPNNKTKGALQAAQEDILTITSEFTSAKQAALPEFEKWLSTVETPSFSPADQIVHIDFDTFNSKKSKVSNLIPTEEKTLTEFAISKNTMVEGPDGQAIKFTGDHPFVIPQQEGTFDREQPFTYSFSFYLPNEYERAILLVRGKATLDSASRGQLLNINQGKLNASLSHFWPGNTINIQTLETLPIQTWQHLTWTYDGSSKAEGMTLFLNGKVLPTKITRNKLTRSITGKNNKVLNIGALMRDKGFKAGELDNLRLFQRVLAPNEIQFLAGLKNQSDKQDLHTFFLTVVHDPTKNLLKKLQTARKKLYTIQDNTPQIMTMSELKGARKKHHVLNRGLYSEKGEEVLPDTPGFLPPLEKKNSSSIATRLDLAHWLIEPNHPLTSRVTVNRYWQMFFGKGLVTSSEDFGNQGDTPSHSELLNWLARDFINHNWDLHHLFKKIVLSHTYRQSTKPSENLTTLDPENKLLARANASPLTAEMIRDNALAVSNLLTSNIGGKPVKPYDIALAFNSKSDSNTASHNTGLYRRSIYTYWKVNGPSPLMLTLDAAKRNICTVRREKTASPLQSLVLLNSPQFVEAARATADNLLKEHNKPEVFIKKAFRLTTSRSPNTKETNILIQLYTEQLQHFSKHPKEAEEYIHIGNTSPSNQHSVTELAALTAVVSALFNFDECNRNY